MGVNCVIQKCSCTSPFQDSKYGNGNRVFNLAFKGDKATCTVCGGSTSVSKAKVDSN